MADTTPISSPQDLIDIITNLIIDNNTNQVTPYIMRAVLITIVNAMQTSNATAITAAAPLNFNQFTNQFTLSIIDNLTAGGSNDVLSAEQGKILKGLVDSLTSSRSLGLVSVLFYQDRENQWAAGNTPISDSSANLNFLNRFLYLSLGNDNLLNDIDLVVTKDGGEIDGMEYRVFNGSDHTVTLVAGSGITLIGDNFVIPKNHTAIIKNEQLTATFGSTTEREGVFSVTYQSNGVSSGGGATDLGYTASPTNGIVISSTGTDATIPLADATNAGLLKPAKYTLLESITEAFTTALKTAYDSAVTWISTNGTNLINHLSNTSNPHSTTASQVGAIAISSWTDYLATSTLVGLPSATGHFRVRYETETKTLFINLSISATSTATIISCTIPYNAKTTNFYPAYVNNNGVRAVGRAATTASSNVIEFRISASGATWNPTSGTKEIQLIIPIEVE